MALQSSGAISLNQIHVEAGGTSGSNASINDADIRALINKASGATMSFSEWYGASATWTSTMTVGNQMIAKIQNYGYLVSIIHNYGSLSDTTIDTFGNRTITGFYWNSLNNLILNITNGPNSGWTSIKVNNTTFNRTAATFGNGSWVWSNTTSNPFGTTVGATKTITFVI